MKLLSQNILWDDRAIISYNISFKVLLRSTHYILELVLTSGLQRRNFFCKHVKNSIFMCMSFTCLNAFTLGKGKVDSGIIFPSLYLWQAKNASFKNALIPGICKYVRLHSEGELRVQNGIKVINKQTLKWGGHPDVNSVHKVPSKWKREMEERRNKRDSEGGRERGRERKFSYFSSYKGTNPVMKAYIPPCKMPGTHQMLKGSLLNGSKR